MDGMAVEEVDCSRPMPHALTALAVVFVSFSFLFFLSERSSAITARLTMQRGRRHRMSADVREAERRSEGKGETKDGKRERERVRDSETARTSEGKRKKDRQ